MVEEIVAMSLYDQLFPEGITRYAIGGILVGLGVVIIYSTTGIAAGASTFLESTLSWFADFERFQRYNDSRTWRLVFTLGIILGAVPYAIFWQGGAFETEVTWWQLFFGGILVGIGTRVGKGCTSGHGVCGVGSVSKTSILGVIIFLSVAIVTAQVLLFTGVTS